ncbi:MAG: hypothetical protein CME97_11595 [Hyphomonas sp.]|nr:hypothetical protein [Hyphomonas sp.]
MFSNEDLGRAYATCQITIAAMLRVDIGRETMEELQAALSEKLPTHFMRVLLDGAMRSILDQQHPLRASNFAVAARELFTQILHYYAPDDDVRNCAWFVQDPNTDRVTRRQRSTYAVQGGLADEYISTFDIDLAELHSEVANAMNDLNRLVHIQPQRLNQSQEEVVEFGTGVLSAMVALMDAMDHCRDAVASALWTQVYEAMMSEFVRTTIAEIDLVAGAGYELDPLIPIHDFEIGRIDSSNIDLHIKGSLFVTLHYGSADDGAEIDHEFPFEMHLYAPTSVPTDLDIRSYAIDDSSWYGSDE